MYNWVVEAFNLKITKRELIISTYSKMAADLLSNGHLMPPAHLNRVNLNQTSNNFLNLSLDLEVVEILANFSFLGVKIVVFV